MVVRYRPVWLALACAAAVAFFCKTMTERSCEGLEKVRTCKRTPIVCLYTASRSTHFPLSQPAPPPPQHPAPHFFCLFVFQTRDSMQKFFFLSLPPPPPPPPLFSFFFFIFSSLFISSDERSRAKLFFFLSHLTGSNALSSCRSSLLINLFYRPRRVSWYLYQARRNWESTLSAITVSSEHN